MSGIRLVAASFVLLLAVTEAYRFYRIKGLFDNFHEYDIIDNDPAMNENGVNVTLSSDFTVLGTTVRDIMLYDMGYISLDPTINRVNVDLLNANPIVPNLPFISANWFPDTVGYGYHMAYTEANLDTLHLQHYLDRVNVEVNKFLDQYPETWRCHNALVVTWETYPLFNDHLIDKYQVVLASGSDATGDKDYVLFLYGSLDVPSDEVPFAYVNGFYTDPANGIGAGVCMVPGEHQTLLDLSNYKCGNEGIYLLDMSVGQECSQSDLQACVAGTSTNVNCMIPTIKPHDTCTESYYCHLTADETAIKFALTMKYYQYAELSAIDYLDFLGTGRDDDPGDDGVYTYIDDALCEANTDSLAFAGTEDALDTVSFETLLNDGLGNCGVQIDTTAGTLKFAFANYKATESDVRQDGHAVVFGICHYTRLPRHISQTNMFNDFSPPTRVPYRQKFIGMTWLDEQGGAILTSAPGDLIYAEICFDPGQFFNLQVDAFGVHAKDCYISNNVGFNNDVSPSTDRSIQVISNGCVSLDSTRAFYFEDTFKVVLPATMGEEWCIRTGAMETAKFRIVGGSSYIYLMCSYGFCSSGSETICHNSCDAAGGGRGTRSVKVATNATEDGSLTIKLNVNDKSEGERYTSERAETDDCIDTPILIGTITVLLFLILIACVLAIVLLMKLKRRYRPEKA